MRPKTRWSRALLLIGTALPIAAACAEKHGEGLSDGAPGRDGGASQAGEGADPDAGAGGGADGAVRNAAGLSGSVSFNLKPDEDCIYSVPGAGGASQFYPVGLYDLGRSGGALTGACEQPYFLHLLALASLEPGPDSRGAGGTVLQIHSASIELMTSEREPIAFGGGSTALPSSFLVTASQSIALEPDGQDELAVVAVEAIPVAYAVELASHAGEHILAEVRLLGTTTGDEDLEFAPFIYPIELCAGCLVVCSEDLRDSSTTPEELLAGSCADQAGADGRVCIDPDC